MADATLWAVFLFFIIWTSNCLSNVIWAVSFQITFTTISSALPENHGSHLPHQLRRGSDFHKCYLSSSFHSWSSFVYSMLLCCRHGSLAAQIRSVPVLPPGKMAVCNSLWQATCAVANSKSVRRLGHRAVRTGNLHASKLTLVGPLPWPRASYFLLLLAKSMEAAVRYAGILLLK